MLFIFINVLCLSYEQSGRRVILPLLWTILKEQKKLKQNKIYNIEGFSLKFIF